MTRNEETPVFTGDLRQALPPHHSLCETAWLREVILQLASLRCELAASRGESLSVEELLGDLAGAQAPPQLPASGRKEHRQ
jgi:hypothetical protein